MHNPLTEEQQHQNQKMDVETLAKVVFRYLKGFPNGNPERQSSFYDVKELRGILLSSAQGGLTDSDYVKLLEAITLLERRGLVMRNLPSRGRGGDQFVVYLTSIGMKSNINDEVILLIDSPEEIVGKLEDSVESLDDIVRQYYLESIRAFQAGLYISSVIDLGVASERAILWLAESIEPYSGPDQAGIKKRRKGHILELTKYLSNTVIPNIFGGDKAFAEELKKRLNGLGDVYRENRNDAGHPQTVDQTSWLGEHQEFLLLQFRRYITTICKAIDYFV